MLAATAAAEDRHAWFRNLRRVAQQTLRQAAPARRFGRILDCGAGTGRNLDWLGDFGQPVGVELTPLAVAVGRAKGRPLIRGSVTHLPFADGTFDLATSFDVLYCLDDHAERQALSEMYRVLAPGGLVLVNVCALEILRGAHSALTHEVRRYTRRQLAERLTSARFQVERITYTNAALFLPTLASRGLERLSGRAEHASEGDLTVPSPIVNRALNVVLWSEAQLLKRVNLPVGTSVMAVARKASGGPA